MPVEEGISEMMRDELLQQIATLPASADVGIQIGDDHLDIVDVVAWGDGGFGALRCNANDYRDLLLAWRLQGQEPGPGSEPTID